MQKYIWLIPLLPLAGAAINGLLGRRFRFSEKLIGGIAVGSVALSFLISLSAVYSYGFGGHAIWPNPYISTQASFLWIPGGAVSLTHGGEERLSLKLQEEAEKTRATLPESERHSPV